MRKLKDLRIIIQIIPVLFLGFIFITVCGLGCGSSGGSSGGGDPLCEATHLDCNDPEVQQALDIIRSLTLQQKVIQMSGRNADDATNFFDQNDVMEKSIPGHRYLDGPRGVRWINSDWGSTVYPVAAARASTWNKELERRIGKACSRELRNFGRYVLLAPTINIVMNPRWGRAQETYGEDTFLLGEMGVSFITGAQYDPKVTDPDDPHTIEQTYRVQSCAKHYAANNIDTNREYVNAIVDERTLREVYLPHFKKAVDAGVAVVMGAYNQINGTYACYNEPLMRGILKDEWEFQGFVVTDWYAHGDTLASPVAGLDVEMPFSDGYRPPVWPGDYFYGPQLVTAVESGLVPEELVDEACLRIIHNKIKFGVLEYGVLQTNENEIFQPAKNMSADHFTLALEAARQGMVLLHNGPTEALGDDVLPLSKTDTDKVAVVGKWADALNTGDYGSSNATPGDQTKIVITPYEGIRDAIPSKTVVTYENVAGNEASIQDSDVVVVVTAYWPMSLNKADANGEEGEWRDRESMDLAQRDLDNINNAVALRSFNPDLKIVIMIKAGGAVSVADWIDDVDALIMAWYGGVDEGQAFAEILFGDVNPSGKICQTFPVDDDQLPFYDTATTGSVTYNYYHGYRYFDKEAGKTPQYYFGYGQSYTTFEYSNLQVANPVITDVENETLAVTVDVQNTGPMTGSEVVQLYVGYDNTSIDASADPEGWGRPVKELKGFARAGYIAVGETRTVTIEVDPRDLRYWDAGAREWIIESMEYQLYVGPSADQTDPRMQTGNFSIE